MAGSAKRFHQLSKADALELHKIVQDLTPTRVGGSEHFLFLAKLSREIEESFPEIRGVESKGYMAYLAQEYGDRPC